MQNMRDLVSGKQSVYEFEYRIQHKDGHYLWFYDRGVITERDSNGFVTLIEGIVFDITKSKELEDKLRNLSETDDLTNIYNRRIFFDNLEKEINKKEVCEACSLIMFDVDHFKKVNDTYGHIVGDNVLKLLSEAVKKNLRSSDTFYRYGGEEFFIILHNTSLNQAIKIAERFRKLIETLQINPVKQITVSMGVVQYQTNDTIDDLVNRADKLMYEAKQAGRNQIKY